MKIIKCCVRIDRKFCYSSCNNMHIRIPLVELFFVFLDLHRPQDVSIALDFLAQEAQETQAHEKNNINKILIKIYNFFSAKSNFFLREKRLFLRKITLKIIFFSTKFCFHAHEKRRPQMCP